MPGAIIVANHIRSLLEHGVDEQFGFWFALALSALFSLVTFTGWWFIRDFLGRHPILGGELFKIGAVVVWFAVIVYFSTPAVAVGFVVVQYFVAAVLIVLSFYDKRVARSTQESKV